MGTHQSWVPASEVVAKVKPGTTPYSLPLSTLGGVFVGSASGFCLYFWQLGEQSATSVITCSALIGAAFGLGLQRLMNSINRRLPNLNNIPYSKGLRESPTTRLMIMTSIYTFIMITTLYYVPPALGIELPGDNKVQVILFFAGLSVCFALSSIYTILELSLSNRYLYSSHLRAHHLAFHTRYQPHTMFNALNTVAALIPDEPDTAEFATQALARLLRNMMRAADMTEHTWTLGEEMVVLKDLLALEHLRFGERLQFDISLDPKLKEAQIPSLILLPLVENALKHGFRRKLGPCQLNIKAENARLIVQDDGVGRTKDAPLGMGLRLTLERLELEGGQLTWKDGPGCTACIELPSLAELKK